MAKRARIMATIYEKHRDYISAEEWDTNFRNAARALMRDFSIEARLISEHRMPLAFKQKLSAFLSIPDAFLPDFIGTWLDGENHALRTVVAVELANVPNWTEFHWKTLVGAITRQSLMNSDQLWKTMHKQSVPAGLYKSHPVWRRALMAADFYRARASDWEDERDYARMGGFPTTKDKEVVLKLFDLTPGQLSAARALLSKLNDHKLTEEDLKVPNRELGNLDMEKLQAFVDIGWKYGQCKRSLQKLGAGKGYQISRVVLDF